MLTRAGLRLVSWQRSSKEVSAAFVGQLLAQQHAALRRVLAPNSWPRIARLSLNYKPGDLVTAVACPGIEP